MKEQKLETLANMQLAILIQKGHMVERSKQEWFRRCKLEYPYFRDASGIRQYGKC